MRSITIQLPQDVLDSARLSVAELKLELAVSLYQQGRLSLGKARELAGISLWQFRQVLAARRIPPHLQPEDVDADAETLRRLGRL